MRFAAPLTFTITLALAAGDRAASAQCVSAGTAMTLTDGNGFTWDIYENGQIADGTNDAFDQGLALSVDGVYFPQAPRTTELAGRQVVHGPVTIGSVEVTRRAFVPNAVAGIGWARFLEYFHNPTSLGVTITVRVESNVGSDGSTFVAGSWSGDTSFTTADHWVITDDGDGTGDPTVLHVLYNGVAPPAAPYNVGLTVFDCATTSGVFRETSIFIPAGSTRILMHFAAQAANLSAALGVAAELDNSTAANMLDGISILDQLRIGNYPLNNDHLFSFSLNRLNDISASGTGTIIGPTGLAASNGTAFGPNGELYAISSPGDAANSRLARIDLTTGAGTPFGAAWGTNNVVALEASSAGTIYAAGLDGGFYRADRVTGALTRLGTIFDVTGVPLPITELAFDNGDQLWALAFTGGNHELYVIDEHSVTSFFAARITGLPATGIPATLAINQRGIFYVTDGETGGNGDLYTVNPSTGVATIVLRGLANCGDFVVAGDFFLHYSSMCGNGARELPFEQCDDGTYEAGDCCNSDCQPQNTGATCRASAGVCDTAEICDAAGTCPSDQYLGPTSTCRVSRAICDAVETCTGTGPGCPPDALQPSTFVCRAAAGVCDAAENCTGMSNACPADAKSTAQCRAAAGVCDVAESCDGTANDCPADSFLATTVICRPEAGPCDRQENCPATGPDCPVDRKRSPATVCRAGTGFCDPAENCDGSNNNCPANSFQPNGTPCLDALVCNGSESCSAGACSAGMPLDCEDDNLCTTNLCSEPGGCGTVIIPGCCNTSADCNDGDACTADTCSGPGGTCAHAPLAACCNTAADCDDADVCTVDTCSGPGGTCTRAPITNCCEASSECNDNLVCTDDACDPSTHRCSFTAIPACCAGPSDCDDSNACTTDACEVASGICSNTTIADCCLAAGDCDDMDQCTLDTCEQNSCVHTASCPDAGEPDGEVTDAEQPDAELPDAELPDAEQPDSEQPDAEQPDAELPDAEQPDAELPDAGHADAAVLPDAVIEEEPPQEISCNCEHTRAPAPSNASGLLLLVLLVMSRRPKGRWRRSGD